MLGNSGWGWATTEGCGVALEKNFGGAASHASVSYPSLGASYDMRRIPHTETEFCVKKNARAI